MEEVRFWDAAADAALKEAAKVMFKEMDKGTTKESITVAVKMRERKDMAILATTVA